MDSFCEEPRKPPVPYQCFENDNRNPFEIYESSSNWTKQEETMRFPNDDNTIYRKQVRFGNPTEVFSKKPYLLDETCAKTNSYKKFKTRINTFNDEIIEEPEKFHMTLGDNKPFEEIYMANIPCRQLDLSLMDISKNLRKENTLNSSKKTSDNSSSTNSLQKTALENSYLDSYSKFRNRKEEILAENKKETKIVDLYNYNYENFKNKDGIKLQCDYNAIFNKRNCENSSEKIDQGIQTEETAVCVSERSSEEPTVKDLLQIVKQQNEQLLLLQKQVARLIENQDKNDRKQIEPPKTREFFQKGANKNLAQYSIDVMTSFEVSIRPQNKTNRFFKDPVINEPKIQEITEAETHLSDNKNNNCCNNKQMKNSDFSLALNEPLNIPEENPSPDHSIHVDMQEYSSDSENEDNCQQKVGWTLYNNIMGQVNQVLNKTCENDKKVAKEKKGKNPLQAVKEATINHLKNMGINVPSDNSDQVTSSNSNSYTPTEISFAVKQLLMKYMPDDHLAKMVQSENKQDMKKMRRPDFSLATIQYMKKYNLLTEEVNTSPTNSTDAINNHKILDITALKKQPKFM